MLRGIRKQISLVDRSMLWLKELYIQLFYENGGCEPLASDAIRVCKHFLTIIWVDWWNFITFLWNCSQMISWERSDLIWVWTLTHESYKIQSLKLYNFIFSDCLSKFSFFCEGVRRDRLHIFVNNNLNTRLNARCKKRYNATILSADITIIKSTRNTHIIYNNQEEKINGEFIYMRTTSKFNITHNDE